MTATQTKRVLKIQGIITDLKEELEGIKDVLESKLENRSERYKEENAESDESEIGYLDDAIDNLESANDELGNLDLDQA